MGTPKILCMNPRLATSCNNILGSKQGYANVSSSWSVVVGTLRAKPHAFKASNKGSSAESSFALAIFAKTRHESFFRAAIAASTHSFAGASAPWDTWWCFSCEHVHHSRIQNWKHVLPSCLADACVWFAGRKLHGHIFWQCGRRCHSALHYLRGFGLEIVSQ